MSLLDSLQEYQTQIAQSTGLIASAHAADATGTFLWSQTERAMIVEAAFLRTFVAWETFLESSFVKYMMGEVTASGRNIACFANPQSQDHAMSMLIGTLSFVDWSAPEKVRKLAKLYFPGGDPFETVISSVTGDIYDLKSIRNASAHTSSTTSRALDGLASRKLQTPVTNITVTDFVLTLDPTSTTGDTILQTYLKILDAAATGIAYA
jgi:hypothetical protein